MSDFETHPIGTAKEIERLRAALEVVDYALTNIWAIDRTGLKRAIADALVADDE